MKKLPAFHSEGESLSATTNSENPTVNAAPHDFGAKYAAPNSTQDPKVEALSRQAEADTHDTALFRGRQAPDACHFKPGDDVAFTYVRQDSSQWPVLAKVESCVYFHKTVDNAPRWHLCVKPGIWYDRKPYYGDGSVVLVPALSCKKA